MLKLVHTADSHLGFSAYSKLTKAGINQRQQDVFDAFDELIRQTVKSGAKVLMISGDLFHHLRPTNKTLAFVIDRFYKLKASGVNVLVIGGNHDTPKTEGASSPLEILEFMDNVVCAYNDYKFYDYREPWSDSPVPLSIISGGYIPPSYPRVHLIPYTTSREKLFAYFDKAKANRKSGVPNILMVHLAWGKFKTMQYDEVCIDDKEMDELRDSFDYIALGHYHSAIGDTSPSHNATYAGTLEYLTFNEVGSKKGYYLLDAGEGITSKFISMSPRMMVDLDALDLSETIDPTRDIIDAIKKYDIKDDIVRMKINNIPALVYRALDFRALRKAIEPALNFDFIFDIKEEAVTFKSDEVAFKPILDEWADFTSGKDVSLATLGKEYIENAEES